MIKKMLRRIIGAGEKDFNPIPYHGSGWRVISEPYTGAWQRNDEIKAADLGSFFAIYSCITLIAGDISKLRARIMATGSDGIQAEQATPSALKRPNRYQNHIQFKQWWATSKLSQGNAYGLKQRDRTDVYDYDTSFNPFSISSED